MMGLYLLNKNTSHRKLSDSALWSTMLHHGQKVKLRMCVTFLTKLLVQLCWVQWHIPPCPFKVSLCEVAITLYPQSWQTIFALIISFTWHTPNEQDNREKPRITLKWLLSDVPLNQLEWPKTMDVYMTLLLSTVLFPLKLIIVSLFWKILELENFKLY